MTNENIIKKINELDNGKYKLSKLQKILMVHDGSMTSILDILNGTIAIKTLIQQFETPSPKIAKLLNIRRTDDVNYRVVLMHKDNKPLIHAISYTPLKRIKDEFKEDLTKKDLPIGKILKKYNVESRREIENVSIEPSTDEMSKLFNSNNDLLTREYSIFKNNEKLIWIKETFPWDYFKE
ncbi:MAG: chorismate pyruvate-lyase family protein [Methanobrevibacter sp.]|jgi:chorismate-pyruvate lyase|nr:chorismate pyruvate-lyase family protein [Methanobrevibacter sp.]